VSEPRLERRGDGRFLVRGLLSFNTVPALWGQTPTLFQQPGPLCIDLREVSHADSAGLALLVGWMREARRRDTEVQFLNIPAQMLAMARVSSLDSILPLGRD
jgi:phospholipid transport system transporter-binding protein